MLHATLYEFETPGFRHWDFMVISSEPLREKNGKIAVVMKEEKKEEEDTPIRPHSCHVFGYSR